MALALALTGIVAYGVSSSETLMQAIFGTPLLWVAMLAPIGIVIYLSSAFNKLSLQGAQLAFWIYAASIGLSLASIFLVYTGTSIARVFFVSAAMFGAMSLYGYSTKSDLSGFGSFLVMGLIGIIIASLVNLFLKSSMMHFVISIIGLFIFIGLTAYDTQRIKNTYFQVAGTGELASKLAVFGALNLYMDFINIFLFMLQFMGDRK
jgi:FtsH-binding integral membrane protein